jgi:hypothetical protein
MKTKTMKILRLLFLLLFIPVTFHAQKTLTGLWTGALSNDSLTRRQDQSFEIALTQYKDKVYGYSRSTFIVNDTLYYIMKRVKGSIVGNVCEVKDDDIISYNFRGKIDKGVKVTTTFRMNKQDSSWHLDGEWKTNQTKKFYAITGKVELKEEPDMEKSKIFPHLEELNLAKEVPFYAEVKKQEAAKQAEKTVAINNPPANKKEPGIKPADNAAKKREQQVQEREAKLALKENKKQAEPIPAKTEPKIPIANGTEPVAVKKPVDEKQKPAETIVTSPEPKKTDPVVTNNKPVEEKKKQAEIIVTNPEPKKTDPVVTNNKPVEEKKKQAEVIAINPEPKKSEPVTVNKPAETNNTNTKKQDPPDNPVAVVPAEKKTTETIIAETKKTVPATITTKPVINVPYAAALVKERKTAPPQEVSFRSDSLVLSLYDNGEVDGDTVSVLMNGEIILAAQGLKTSAIKKTIYMQPGTDEVMLVLYAENLGKYPPNTGLLVIYDGDDRYQVRFSADLQQNASVIFRRKRN